MAPMPDDLSPMLEALVDTLDPVFVMASERDGLGTIVDFRYVYLNANATAMVADDEGSLIGRRMLELHPTHVENGLFTKYCEVVESGEPMVTEVLFDQGGIHGWFEVVTHRFQDGWISFARNIDAQRTTREQTSRHAERLRATLDSMLDPHVVLDAVRNGAGEIVDFVYVDANEAACRYNRTSRERLIGAHLLDLLPGHTGTGLLEMYEQVVESGTPLVLDDFRYNQEILDEERYFDIRGVKVGNAVSYTWRDVTDRHLAQAAIAEVEARYRLLAEHSSDAVIESTPDGVLTFVSPSVTRLLGWQPTEVIGRPFADLIHPDDLAEMTAAHRRLSAGTVVRYKVRVRTSAGAHRWLTVTVSPFLDSDRAIVGLVAGWSDAQNEVDAFQHLQVSEARYRLLADVGSDVVSQEDAEGRITWVSASVTRALGWEPEELVGLRRADLLHPDDYLQADNDYGQLFASNDPQPISQKPVRVRTKSGGYRWMSRTGVPQRDDDGHLTSVVNGLHDVDELVRAREKADHDAKLLKAVMDSSRDSLIRFDTDGRVTFVNSEVVRLSGRSADVWIGHTHAELGYSDEVSAAYLTLIQQVANDGMSHSGEIAMNMGDGVRWFEASLSPVFDGEGRVVEVLCDSRDVTDRHRTVAQLTTRATHDPLTKLANRDALLDELERALAAAHRTGQLTAVLMIDLDHFKDVNDSLGHGAGDQLLVAAAHRLEASSRAGDLVARLGGDEFAVVSRSIGDDADAVAKAQRIVEAFRLPFIDSGNDLSITVSIGVAMSSRSSEVIDLLRDADAALYVAKEAGRNRAVMFHPHVQLAVDTGGVNR